MIIIQWSVCGLTSQFLWLGDCELNPALVIKLSICMCSLEIYGEGGVGGVVHCWAASKPNSTLHFDTFSAYENQGWTEGKGGWMSVHHFHPTLHDRLGLQPPPPPLPPPLHMSSPLRLHPSFSLSVHLVCLSKSSGWKTLTCVRLCYLNIYTHGNKRWKKKKKLSQQLFYF